MQQGEGAQVKAALSQVLNCNLTALTRHIILTCEHSTRRPLINMIIVLVEVEVRKVQSRLINFHKSAANP